MAYEFVEEKEPVPQRSTAGKIKDAAIDVARHPLRTASRVAEQAIGLPGDLLSLLNEVGKFGSKLAGLKPVPYEETLVGKAIPTTKTHREAIKKGTGGFLEPQNKFESFIDDLVQDVTSLALPVKHRVPFKKTATNALAIALGSNLAGSAAEDFTADKGVGAGVKAGSMFLLSLLNPQSAKKMASGLYDLAESSIPKGAKASAKSLEQGLQGLKTKVLAGREPSALAPSEKFVMDEADKVLGLIKNGEIPVESAWAAKRSLNENLQNVLFSTPDKFAKGRARHLAKTVSGQLSDVLKGYATKNPAFKNSYLPAEEAYATLAKSNVVEKFMKDNLKNSPVTYGLVHLVGGPVGATAATAIAPYQLAKLMYRIVKSPTLRKHYANSVKAAGKQNATVFNRELQKLDKGLQEEEKKDAGYEFVD